MDVRDPRRVNEIVHEWRPEVVVHLASIVTPGKDSSRELERAVDVDGTRNVLDACLTHEVRRIVVSSSGAAYGYHPDSPEWITEDQPVRGNEEFAYADHKRQVEEMLAELRESQPRAGAGGAPHRHDPRRARRQPDHGAVRCARGCSRSAARSRPFVFIWDTDVAAIIQRAVTGSLTGIFNVAGDGAMTVDEIAAALGKPTLAIPEPVLRAGLARGQAARPHGVRTGADEVPPVPSRCSTTPGSRTVFGYTPSYTSAEAFEAWKVAHRL